MMPMIRIQEKARLSPIGTRPEAAQDVVYRWLKQQVLSLPLYPELSDSQVAQACEALRLL